MLAVEFSRQRQKRLLDVMQRRSLDAIVVGVPHHIYYFSAFLQSWLHQAGFILFADGRSVLVSANAPALNAAADQVLPYEANWFSTLRQEQPLAVAEQLVAALKSHRARMIGVDASAVTSQVAMRFEGECMAIDPELWQLRRRKDPDELELMKAAIRCCEAMYARAKEIISAGIPELEVFTELHSVAVQTSGAPMTALLGNDFACGQSGGPARQGRVAGDGELYILDLGPTVRGYFSDTARTFSVNRQPTEKQYAAWEATVGALKLVENLARPGAACAEIFAAVDEHFKQKRGTGMASHLGHGIGLQPHEYPHLNPKWDDVLMEGEVFTAEPGQYGPELAGGLRLENQYLLTKDSAENLVAFPLEMI